LFVVPAATGSWDGSLRLWPRPSCLGGRRSGSEASSAAPPSCGLQQEDSEGDAAAVGEAGDSRPSRGKGAAVAGAGGSEGGGAAAGGGRGGCNKGRERAALLLSLGRRASEAGSAAGGVPVPRRGGGGAGGAAPAGGGKDAGARGGQDVPGSLGARLADLGERLLGEIEAEYKQHVAAGHEKLGGCYVAAAAEAAAAAASAAGHGGSPSASGDAGGSRFASGAGSLGGGGSGGSAAVAAVGPAAARKQQLQRGASRAGMKAAGGKPMLARGNG
jgi:hypothetical protein